MHSIMCCTSSNSFPDSLLQSPQRFIDNSIHQSTHSIFTSLTHHHITTSSHHHITSPLYYHITSSHHHHITTSYHHIITSHHHTRVCVEGAWTPSRDHTLTPRGGDCEGCCGERERESYGGMYREGERERELWRDVQRGGKRERKR